MIAELAEGEANVLQESEHRHLRKEPGPGLVMATMQPIWLKIKSLIPQKQSKDLVLP